MARQAHPETIADCCDRLLQTLVGKRLDFAAALIDDVMVVAFRVGDLIPCDAVAPVQTVQQPEFEQLIEYPVDRGGRANALGAQLIGEFLGAQEALALSRQELHNSGTRGTRLQTSASEPLLGPLKPAIAERRIHSRSLA